MERFWERINYLLGLLCIAALFILVAFTAHIEIKDLDLWLHIATGKFITTHGFVPAYDVLSCTIPGKPWVNHEWLFQVLVYKIFSIWGPDGLISMQAIVVVFTFLLLLLIGYSRDRQFATAFLLLLVLLTYQVRLTIRPDIFSLLFFTIYILILSLHLNKRWSIYFLFFIQVLWSNFHGFFFLGPFMVIISLSNEWVKRHVRLPWELNQVARLSDEEYGRLKLLLLFTLAACCINPLTFEGAWYPIHVLTNLSGESKVFFDNIQELQRPTSWSTLFSLDEYPHYKLLILLSFYSFLLNFSALDIGVFVFWLFFLWFSLIAKRNLVFFALAAYFVSLSNVFNLRLMNLLPITFTAERFRYMTAVLIKIFFLLWVGQFGMSLLNHGYYDFDKFERKSEFLGVTQRNFPNKALDFLVENQVTGNFFNDFNSGAYMLGRAFPNIKVFIDGRTEVYGPQFFKFYKKIYSDGNDALLDEAIQKYHLTGALLGSIGAPVPKEVLNNFYKKGWALVYLDYDAVVFLNPEIPENQPLIAKHKLDLGKWKFQPIDLQRIGAVSVTPFQQIHRAYTLEDLGFSDAALQEIEDALKIAPDFPHSYKLLGKIYGERQDHKKAFENFRIAVTLNPDDLEARMNLAMAYENLGDLKNAIKQFSKTLALKPDRPQIYFRLSRAYAKDQQYEKSINVLGAAHKVDPQAAMDLLMIGDIIFSGGDYSNARQAYQMALETKKHPVTTHHKIGMTYQKEGRLDEAREEFEKGLAIKPDYEALQKSLRELDAEKK